MNKRTVIQELDSMIVFRLFGDRPYLADEEAGYALSKKLDEMGLQACVPGEAGTTTNTALGRELQLDLVMVFVGMWCEFEVPRILEEHGLIDEFKAAEIFDLFDDLETAVPDDKDLSDDYGRVLRPVVQKAYRDHYHPSGLQN